MRKKPQKIRKTMTSLAASMGISRSTLYTWKETGAPIDKGEGAILEWAMAENRRGADTDEMRAAKLGVLRQTERRLKIANDEKSKDILKRADVEREATQAMGLLWQTLDKAFGYELPPQLVGCNDVHEIASRLAVQLDKFKGVLELEFRRVDGEAIPASEFEAVKLSAEAVEVLQVCNRRAWDEKVTVAWSGFMDWKRLTDDQQAARWRAWLLEAAAKGIAVPCATDAELVAYPGLKRTESHPKNAEIGK
jgi:hypothetical protein